VNIIRLTVSVILLLGLAVSCHSELTSVPITDAKGNRIRVTEDPAVPPEDEGIVSGEPWKTPRYSLDQPLSASAEAPDLAVTYEGSVAEPGLRLFGADGTVLRDLPLPKPEVAGEGTVTAYVPLDVGWSITSFEVYSKCRCGTLTLRSLRLTSAGSIFRRDREGATIRAGTEITTAESITSVRLPKTADTGGIRIVLHATGLTAGAPPADVLAPGFERPAVELFLEGPGHSVEYLVHPRNGETTIPLYWGTVGFIPTAFHVDSRGLPVLISEVDTERIPEDPRTPIAAELGTVLGYPVASWRRPDWEIFEWTLYPNTFVIDFADYHTQSAYFKRLAFFTEKRGFQGQLLDQGTLDRLHGWNAHNYSAEALRRFFTAADNAAYEMRPEERELRELAIDLGLLHESENGLRAGEGGLLSISRESSPVLREVLLSHEAFHGVFYARRDYREFAERRWFAMTEEGRAFWTSFLSFMTYEPSDEYLMINEFQAYILQQRPRTTDWYFTERMGERLQSAGSRAWPLLESLLQTDPDHFRDTAEAFNHYVLQTEGLLGGEVVTLRSLQ
jgi:hypothetical protein